MFNIITVRSHGKHKEESGKNILTLCYPGDRFYTEGMYREQTGYKDTWPEFLCHPVEYKKKKYGVYNMEEKIHQVIALGVEAKDLIVKHQ
jgi:hypothetical protein